jgi:phenylacetate-CoA ligase
MDQLTVRVERRPGIDAVVGDQGGAALGKLVKNHIGVTVAVDVVDPGGIERSVGKMRRIIDNRPKG